MVVVPKVRIKRTSTPNKPPTALDPGELAVEMSTPTRLWVGVPTNLDPSGMKMLAPSSGVTVADAPPNNPQQGALWWEADTGYMWMYYIDATSGQWVQVNGANSESGGIKVSDLPPAAPENGDCWFESDTTVLWMWYEDPNGSQWVQLTGGLIAGGAIGGGGGLDQATADSLYVNATGDTMSGVLRVVPDGNQFGGATGTSAGGGVQPQDANIKLYDHGNGNWAGIGSDPGGNMWFRTGLTGTPAPAMYIGADNQMYIREPSHPQHPTTKGYVDAVVGNAAASVNNKVNKTGDSMTGQLTVYTNGQTVSVGGFGPGGIGLELTSHAGASWIQSWNRSNNTGAWLTLSASHVHVRDSGFEVAGLLTARAGVHISNGGFTVAEGNVTIYGNTTINANLACVGVHCKQGVNAGITNDRYNWFWNGMYLYGFIETTNIGAVYMFSDYRIKKDIANLPSMWNRVKALRPIKYKRADYNPKSEEHRTVEGKTPLFIGDDTERWGFIAHELQDTLTPSASTGVKDEENLIQSPDPMAVIAAVTKALQEAMARIETLTADVAALKAARA